MNSSPSRTVGPLAPACRAISVSYELSVIAECGVTAPTATFTPKYVVSGVELSSSFVNSAI
jgi:hypothetical protein